MHATSVNVWITIEIQGIVYIYNVTIYNKSKVYLAMALINRGDKGIIIEICQNELFNHTHVTVPEYTVFERVFRLNLDVLF
jgi:hypothetical protein